MKTENGDVVTTWSPPFGGVSGMLTGRRPRTSRRDNASFLTLEHLKIPQGELEGVAGGWGFGFTPGTVMSMIKPV